MRSNRMTGALRWKVIAMIVGIIASTTLLTGGYPLAKQALRDREARRIQTVYATGLSPCPQVLDDPHAAWRRAQFPADAEVTIEIYPGFESPRFVAVAGSRLYDLGYHHDESGAAALPLPTHRREVAFPATMTRALRETLNADVAHTSRQPLWALDGTTYVFRTADGGCAEAYSPRPGSRASDWVDLAHALMEGASASTAIAPDRRWREAIRHLEALRAR